MARWEQLPINTKFERAMRTDVYRRLTSLVRRKPRSHLRALDDLRSRVRLFDQRYVGIRPIRVQKVVGTASGTEDFGADFLPRRPEVSDRWMRLERAFPDGDFPPILAFQVGDSYFVVDGHHRVAIARQRGIEYIDAEVTELRARFEIPPGADIGKMIMAEQKSLFMEESGLQQTLPEVSIEVSLPQGYVELLELIKVHAHELSVERGEVVQLEEAARDFFEDVYLPTVEAIRDQELGEAFPRWTEADLFLWICERRRSLFPERGDLELSEVVAGEAREARTRRS
ncbi:MAG: hypothetical protein ACRDJV_03490 [Actinomycetota bacterium]